MQFDLAIKGNLILPNEILNNGIVGIKDGKILLLSENSWNINTLNTVDATGKWIFPGIVDCHVHSFSDPTEGFVHSTKAAAAGGITTIIEMPYDKGNPINTVPAFEDKISLVEKDAVVDVALLATIKKEGNLDIIRPINDLGACGFKMSLYETDPQRFPRIETDILYKAFPIFKELNLPVGFHAEEDSLIEPLIAEFKNAGTTFPRAHCYSRPPISESLSVLKLLELAYWTKAPLHIYHISHPRCMELVCKFREMGVNVSAETCPHYLTMDENDMDRVKAMAKINPPLRLRPDVEKMWEFVENGSVDTIASDHAPWSIDTKTNENIFLNSSGAPGLESLFPITYTEALNRGIGVKKIADLLSWSPAKRFGLSHCKGSISVGKDADFTIVNPDMDYYFDAKKSLSSAKWSPYNGMKLKGKVVRTILRGKVIFEDGTLKAQCGNGTYIRARHQ